MQNNKEKSTIKRFIKKLFILFIPLIIVMAIYLHDDPFMVFKDYPQYDSTAVVLDDAYVCWQTYMHNRDTIPFNSFILGNSCTMAFNCHEWEKYLKEGRAIRLFGNDEGIVSIYEKLEALDKMGTPIKNVLMMVDNRTLINCQPSLSHTNILPPAVSGISNFKFQTTFFQTFFNPNFIIPYLDYKIAHKYRPYMHGIINPYGVIREKITNDAINPREAMIKQEGEKYWENHKNEFRKKRDANYRDGKYKKYPPVLFDNQIDILEKIKKIFVKNNTSYKIIISPEFNQTNLDKTDVKKLEDVFGAANVFDYTGINKYTNDWHNYYEKSHYRSVIGAQILKEIYGKEADPKE